MTTQPTPEQLIQGCKENDRRAQKQVYNMFKSTMFGICLQYAHTTMEAEDILQDSFVKVFTNVNSYTGEGPLGGWIRRIVVNTALSAWRKNQLIAKTHAEAFLGGGTLTEGYNDSSYLLRTINTLPENQRISFTMHVEGYSHKEIAEVTGMSIMQSRVQLCRAKTLLREKIEKIERSINTRILGAQGRSAAFCSSN